MIVSRCHVLVRIGWSDPDSVMWGITGCSTLLISLFLCNDFIWIPGYSCLGSVGCMGITQGHKTELIINVRHPITAGSLADITFARQPFILRDLKVSAGVFKTIMEWTVRDLDYDCRSCVRSHRHGGYLLWHHAQGVKLKCWTACSRLQVK